MSDYNEIITVIILINTTVPLKQAPNLGSSYFVIFPAITNIGAVRKVYSTIRIKLDQQIACNEFYSFY